MGSGITQQTAPALNLDVVSGSWVESSGVTWGMARTDHGTRLAVLAGSSAGLDLGTLDGDISALSDRTVLIGPLSPRNAATLRGHLPWLAPTRVGARTSAGLGDRLGLATPGHVRALRAVGGSITPVFAQQSIREMTRTRRTPQEVIDAATWGAFEAGWRTGFGADADHLKTTADIDSCLAAGFTWFTIDPGQYVHSVAATATPADVRAAVARLPWEALADTQSDLVSRYAGAVFEIEQHRVSCDDETVLRAAIKYGWAVAHVAAMYRHVADRVPPGQFDFEVSVDETDTPTTPAEHLYVVRELARLGVRWGSLAPRFVGRFEKGVDYIGDLGAFEADFAVHAAIARQFGSYKLSLHSGSDKFRIYPIAARHTRGLVHLKTAGTSYLEALRTVAQLDAALFRDIYVFALDHYDADRASYHVSAETRCAPDPAQLADDELALVLDDFHARQILHVTFGSVLTTTTNAGGLRFADRLVALLRSNPDAHGHCLEAHFVRHLEPFAQPR
jgi:hypothetical protein